MHKTAKLALRLIETLTAKNDRSAYHVTYSEFPDRDEGPDEGYEQQIQAEFDLILDEIAVELTKKYGRPLPAAPAWSQLRATGWSTGSTIIYAFLERDDWDTPLIMNVGCAGPSSRESAEDPWSFERKDAS